MLPKPGGHKPGWPKLCAAFWRVNPVLTGKALKYHFALCTEECDMAESIMLSNYLD